MSEFSGQLSLRAAARAEGRTALAAQSFRAPYHLSKPYWDVDTRTLLVQVVNPTAGILAGDRLEAAIAAVLAQGLRTRDIAAAGEATISTTAMGDAIVAALRG